MAMLGWGKFRIKTAMAISYEHNYPGPPWYQFNGHLQTILAAFGGPEVMYRRERLELDDGDFLDIDWLQQQHAANSLVILTHGLEGNSQRPYIRSAAHFFHERGWDVIAWNCRSCSGEMNRTLRLYHHGEISDIHTVTTHALDQGQYQQVVFVGYSMGGAMLTKYLSVHHQTLPDAVLGGIAFSSPFDLAAGVDALELPGNGIYKKRFLRQLGGKLQDKAKRFPGVIDISRLAHVKTWRDFDEWFTAPLLQLSSAKEFYDIASAKNFVNTLNRPVLAVNALNDPIITDDCLPLAEAPNHPFLHLEITEEGGHVGYQMRGQKGRNWMNLRAWEEIEKWVGE